MQVLESRSINPAQAVMIYFEVLKVWQMNKALSMYVLQLIILYNDQVDDR